MNIGQLCFLEVGGDETFLHRYQRHQIGSRLDIFSRCHGAVGHDAIKRNFRVDSIEPLPVAETATVA